MAHYKKGLEIACKVFMALLAIGLIGASIVMVLQLEKWNWFETTTDADGNTINDFDKSKHFFFAIALLGGGLLAAVKVFKKYDHKKYDHKKDQSLLGADESSTGGML